MIFQPTLVKIRKKRPDVKGCLRFQARTNFAMLHRRRLHGRSGFFDENSSTTDSVLFHFSKRSITDSPSFIRCRCQKLRNVLAMRRQRSIAMMATTRKLAVRLYWMWRKEWDRQQSSQFGSHAGQFRLE
jgi:hypothetical protein